MTDWLSVSDKELAGGISAAQRQGEAGRGRVQRRQLPPGGDGARRRRRQLLRGATRPSSRFPRSGRSGTCSSTSTRCARRSPCRRPTSSAPTTTTSTQFTDARTDARQPHPAQDRRQGRRGGEGEGRGGAEAGARAAPTSRSSRRSTPRTSRTRRTAATSTTSAAAAWCPSSTRRRSRCRPGQISDLVKTQFGYHIIKLMDKKAGTTRPLEEVRQQLTDQLQSERAQAQARDLAREARRRRSRSRPTSRPRPRRRACTVQETGFFAQDEPILGVGAAPEMAARAFAMNDGEVSAALRHAVAASSSRRSPASRMPYVPKLDEVKDKVRDDVIKQRARGDGEAEGRRGRREAEGRARTSTRPRRPPASKRRRPSSSRASRRCRTWAPSPDDHATRRSSCRRARSATRSPPPTARPS